MTNCEKLAHDCLLRRHSPEIALEIRTFHGGSLQILAKFTRSVISIDIDERVQFRRGQNQQCGFPRRRIGEFAHLFDKFSGH